jgi:hypothetical protein
MTQQSAEIWQALSEQDASLLVARACTELLSSPAVVFITPEMPRVDYLSGDANRDKFYGYVLNNGDHAADYYVIEFEDFVRRFSRSKSGQFLCQIAPCVHSIRKGDKTSLLHIWLQDYIQKREDIHTGYAPSFRANGYGFGRPAAVPFAKKLCVYGMRFV